MSPLLGPYMTYLLLGDVLEEGDGLVMAHGASQDAGDALAVHTHVQILVTALRQAAGRASLICKFYQRLTDAFAQAMLF